MCKPVRELRVQSAIRPGKRYVLDATYKEGRVFAESSGVKHLYQGDYLEHPPESAYETATHQQEL